jgi:tRNA(fMet)-specific endonuclease VapC
MKENLVLIDTDILIFILKNNPIVLKNSIEYQEKIGNLKISELTYYECLRGFKYSNSPRKLHLFEEFAKLIEIIPLNRTTFIKASEIYGKLKKIGFPTGEFDLLIAATAIENKLTLITNNTKHYIKISEYFNLAIDNWLK